MKRLEVRGVVRPLLWSYRTIVVVRRQRVNQLYRIKHVQSLNSEALSLTLGIPD